MKLVQQEARLARELLRLKGRHRAIAREAGEEFASGAVQTSLPRDKYIAAKMEQAFPGEVERLFTQLRIKLPMELLRRRSMQAVIGATFNENFDKANMQKTLERLEDISHRLGQCCTEAEIEGVLKELGVALPPGGIAALGK